jgi:transcriptional regulator with XRE-family HTH domain
MSKEILPIAQGLNRLRHERRLALSQLAIRLNIPLHTVRNWEQKNGPYPRLQTAVLLADFYGVSLDYLTGRTDERGN